MPLTKEEKFQRRISRKVEKKNEKIKADYPLFFDQFKTTYEREEWNTIEKQSWSCERLFEGLDCFTWRTWFKIEIYKRALTNIGRRDLIFQSYKKYYKFDLGNEMLANLLCQELFKLTEYSPRQVAEYIEDKTKVTFGQLIKDAAIINP